eukprot:TRINITY_DN4557_c0_g1_i2.p1 TRINITY_DN4557_c0_g1~~TRINITY_DN4557_c0_g1_i2.p1  ORF type:complete len:322 (+),score=76.43 TRINITY_DN4557_c0_g1_i2:30-968(+)
MARVLKLALDWTPNTNHTGFFVAIAKGFYKRRGLDVTLISPAMDNYALTPGRRVEQGEADLCLAPSESAISFNTAAKDVPKLKAVATCIQRDTSAICSLQSNSRIQRPKDLDNATYASYDGRFEMDVVKALIRADGGEGTVKEVKPDKLGIWNTLCESKYDSTWIFMGHEGFVAKQQGVDLRTFQLRDYGINYGYTPVVLAHPQLCADKESLSLFLEASKEGFQFAASQPEAAVNCLPTKEMPDLDDDHLLEAQRYMSDHYLTSDGDWGVMEADVWNKFMDFIKTTGDDVQLRDGSRQPWPEARDLWTNEYL